MLYITGKFHSEIKENKIQYILYLFQIYTTSPFPAFISCRYFGHLSRIRSHVNTTDHNIIQMYKFPKGAVLDIREKRKYKH
jgi:hypothetical protein